MNTQLQLHIGRNGHYEEQRKEMLELLKTFFSKSWEFCVVEKVQPGKCNNICERLSSGWKGNWLPWHTFWYRQWWKLHIFKLVALTCRFQSVFGNIYKYSIFLEVSCVCIFCIWQQECGRFPTILGRLCYSPWSSISEPQHSETASWIFSVNKFSNKYQFVSTFSSVVRDGLLWIYFLLLTSIYEICFNTSINSYLGTSSCHLRCLIASCRKILETSKLHSNEMWQ